MSQVPKFGFSAFLKLINSNTKPQKRLVRDRFRPSTGGYDFHKSLRQRVQQIAFENLGLQEALVSAAEISKKAERESAIRGLRQFFEWRQKNTGDLSACESFLFSSPKGLFKVEFTPNFLIELNGRRTAVHLWNTRQALSAGLVNASLCMVAKRHPLEGRPDDFAVLSLQDGRLFKWSDATKETAAFGEKLLEVLDLDFANARLEFGLPGVVEGDAPDAPTP
ncbi:hypothetical protein GOC91_19130 [Sinorhizobium medicae]|uniref:Uncharacterized protein n=1 Tax=Sinorhizobium medicae TaxID=110321 RepID=A0A508WS98_9HYPH|nr:hypothetical protein [Sinorhizobium medicae]MDX0425395.1 hypothetical protein [Sinorhizobium medicae]MDX0523731.1 hypothetical protein [Sinorhizobium medicae]MDX0548319.1 hypothetical protein [Sinorhizobium medicae]MDX0628318.1 hypothetical protein [Sinorhizobium medicae]MDX0635403.1 hypothetical protein [Sinorhizobium medicae]